MGRQMKFSKSEMEEELLTFLNLFGEDIANLYGINDREWVGKDSLRTSPVFKAVSEMYDYGVTGTPMEELLPGAKIDGVYAYVERFLRAMDTPQMRLLLEQNDNTPPHLAMTAVQSAVARIVLDGGDRYTDFGAVEYGVRKGDYGYLTLAEVALLADMDERSVRNAANPKLPDPLKTEQVGKRSLVSPKEARRWLAGRKGYVQTKDCGGRVAQRAPEYDLGLTEEMVEIIEREAKKAGMSFGKYVLEMMIKTQEGLEK